MVFSNEKEPLMHAAMWIDINKLPICLLPHYIGYIYSIKIKQFLCKDNLTVWISTYFPDIEKARTCPMILLFHMSYNDRALI